MAADFWLSSHGNQWLFDRQTVAAARTEDLKFATRQEIGWIAIWSANVMHRLSRKLNLKQQVTATAILFFRRFYLSNSYADTEPCLVAATCLYLAAKAEELPVHIKTVVAESRSVFQEMGFSQFPTDNSKLAQMEFYLLEDLQFHLIVHHPYRALVQFTGRDNTRKEDVLDMDDQVLQMAWFIINDTYRSDLCLLYPPHIIALAAVYLAFALNPNSKSSSEPKADKPTPPAPPPPAAAASSKSESSSLSKQLHPSLPARPDFIPSYQAYTSSSSSNASTPPATHPSTPPTKIHHVTFLARLNVPLALVLEVIQDITSLYSLWHAYEEVPAGSTDATNVYRALNTEERVVKILARMRDARALAVAHP